MNGSSSKLHSSHNRTLFQLSSEWIHGLGKREKQFQHEVPRISCNITQQEFQEKIVRKRKAVILTGCTEQYRWLEKLDLSLEGAIKVGLG